MLTQMLFALYAEIKKKISIFIPEEREFTVQSKNTEHNWKSKVNYQIDGSLSHSCYHPTIKKIKTHRLTENNFTFIFHHYAKDTL